MLGGQNKLANGNLFGVVGDAVLVIEMLKVG